MGKKDGKISLLHSLWPTQIVHLLHRLLASYPIAHRIGLSLLLVNFDNFYPLQIARKTARLIAFSYFALVGTELREV